MNFSKTNISKIGRNKYITNAINKTVVNYGNGSNESTTDLSDVYDKITDNDKDIEAIDESINTLNGEVKTLNSNVADLPNKYISKVNADSVTGKITFNGGIETTNGIINDYISSPTFSTGSTGWRIYKDTNNEYCLELDNITVRGTFNIYQLLISKIRAINGGLVISSANATIKEIIGFGDDYFITLDSNHTFVANDIIRC
jgi:hypothetical protein